MLYSDEHETAIFRIPKVAGHALSAALVPQGFVKHAASKPDIWGEKGLWAESFVDRMIERKPEVARYRTATFVRHPEDKLVSAWRYISSRCPAIPEGQLPFRWFARRVILGKGLMLGTVWHAGLPQSHLLAKDGKLQVEFVGKYESLNEDFRRFCRWAEIQPAKLRRVFASGPPVDYRDFYTPDLRQAVRRYFQQDYELFGYK